MNKFEYRNCVQCGGKLGKRRDRHGVMRLICRRCGGVEYQNPKPTVGLLLVCRRELLLVRRARTPFQGWWDSPGGFVEKGELLEGALAREVQEELGIRIREFTFFGSAYDTYAGEPVLGSYFITRVSRKPVLHPADDAGLFTASRTRSIIAGN